MRRWALIGLILALLLAACGGDDQPSEPASPTATAPNADATEEALGSGYELEPLTPGLNVRNGLTLLSVNEGVQGDVAYFFAEVRNDTGQYLRQVDAVIYPLDEYQLQVGEFSMAPLLTDIPPDQTFFVGRAYALQPEFVDSQRWVWYTPAEDVRYQGVFNLPVTIESRGALDSGGYAVRGTVQNTGERDLHFPVIDVALIGPEDTIVGLARGVLQSGSSEGVLPAGAAIPFEAVFGFTSVPTEDVVDARVLAAGYIVD